MLDHELGAGINIDLSCHWWFVNISLASMNLVKTNARNRCLQKRSGLSGYEEGVRRIPNQAVEPHETDRRRHQ